MQTSRRTFFGIAAAGLGAAVLRLPQPAVGAPITAPRIKLALSSYSYWHFRPPKTSIESVIEKASALGVAGVDVLHRQMDLEEKAPLDPSGRAYLRKLKHHAFLHGVSLICVSTHQNFVSP